MAAYTSVVVGEVMRSELGCIFIIRPRGYAHGLDEKCDKKRGTKDSPWLWIRSCIDGAIY